MIKVENLEVFNFDGALRGMRNPLESWDKSDSYFEIIHNDFIIGKNDLGLAQRLIKGGSEHCKFMRQIFVSMDITAPIYWWKEMDTYKIGTTANSTSTMHKIMSKPITKDCFSFDFYNKDSLETNHYIENLQDKVISICENLRLLYIKTGDKDIWRALIQFLPCGWLQTRTWTGSYANLRNIVFQRDAHKLNEWKSFLTQLKQLPYAEELIFYKGEE